MTGTTANNPIFIGNSAHRGISPEQIPDWAATLRRFPNNTLLQSDDNIQMILENDPGIAGKILFNTLLERTVVTETSCWYTDPVNPSNGTPMDDAVLLALKEYFHKHYWLISKKRLVDSITLYTSRHTFHPVCRLLDNTVWDGVPRISNLFTEYMGAEDTYITHRISEVFVLGFVQCARIPGCKFDYLLILHGKQGSGKSTFLQDFGGDWFIEDTSLNLDSRDSKDQRRGHLLVELPEMLPVINNYGRMRCLGVKHSVGNILVGTTNEISIPFMPAKKGSMRYLPVHVENYEKKLTPNIVAQLLAEADCLLKKGNIPCFTREEEKMIEAMQDEAKCEWWEQH